VLVKWFYEMWGATMKKLRQVIDKNKTYLGHINKIKMCLQNPAWIVRVDVSEMGRLLGVKLRKHKYNLKEGHFHKSKLALFAFEEGHKLIGHKILFWKLSPILCFGNIMKRLRNFVPIIRLFSRVWKYLIYCSRFTEVTKTWFRLHLMFFSCLLF